ncbi:MAG TPA: fumarylacetoacetate hydrolase family protein [Alphaproteobacteria bacterium]|nr:fumarylacetoacetate hydrolase family protein [Alphaproteobacteria bacterium]
MRFVTFEARNRAVAAPGLVVETGAAGEAPGSVIDLAEAFRILAALGRLALPPDWRASPPSLAAIIAAGEAGLEAVRVVARADERELAGALVPWSEVRLRAPIERPAKNVFCVGRNYAEHVAEGYRARGQELKLPEHPQFFTKPRTAVIGPDAAFPLDENVTQKLDYEVELAVIIGTTGRDIPAARAYDHVFGYTILNDITARDLQRRHEQWFKGKALDASCPMGPWIVHKSAIADPQRLAISLTVNGETRQSANTAQMIFPIAQIIEVLSRGMTLEAGDIIATGTPSGVGFAMEPPRFLKPGDVVECRIEGIGRLATPIVARSVAVRAAQ